MVHASLIRQMYPQCPDSGKIEDRNLRIYVITNVKDKAWLVLIFLAMVMGLLLFLPAWTVRDWQAWAFLAVLFWGVVVDYPLPAASRWIRQL